MTYVVYCEIFAIEKYAAVAITLQGHSRSLHWRPRKDMRLPINV